MKEDKKKIYQRKRKSEKGKTKTRKTKYGIRAYDGK